jgi:ArsR family transcriptional regulator, arsenate/arsenite/antimonite-responsive transcriptional repressor
MWPSRRHDSRIRGASRPDARHFWELSRKRGHALYILDIGLPDAGLDNPTRLKIYRMLVRAGDPGLSVGKLQSRLSIPGSTLSHHLKTLIIVGLVSQERDATTLICRANYPVMRGPVEFLVAECCAEADCTSLRQHSDTAA